MPGLATRLVTLYTRRVIRMDSVESPQQLVRHLRRAMQMPVPAILLPPGIRAARFTGHGIAGDWLQVKGSRRALLYFHGGGYIAGITRTCFPLCGQLARRLDADVFLPEYRLAPEHPFPAAVDDAVAAWDTLLEHGWHPQNILVAGDSAGGGLTLALLLRLRDSGRTLPAAAIAMSPFADMTATAASHIDNDHSDSVLSAAMISAGESLYVQDPEQRRHPHASPVFADFTGLPPLLLTVSENECLRDDTHAVLRRARQARVPASLISRPDQPHVWPVFWPLLPEARADVRQMAAFARRTVAARP
ncbi:MAG: alpha/beta hydrolase fold domain-containing protein [Pseudomonadota bacterium]